MTVIALNEHWNVTRDWVYQVLGRKLWLGPFGFIPSAAQNPLAFRGLFYLCRDAFCELLRGCGISKLNLIELCTALDEMHVCVVKSRQQQFAASIDHFGLRTAPQIYVRAGANRHNAISNYSDCFGFWLLFIYSVNGSVSYNQCCRRFRLCVRVHDGHN